MITRRTFLKMSGAATLAAGSVSLPQSFASLVRPVAQKRKVALITTIYHYRSHSQHISDRFVVGYPKEGSWHHPNTQIVSSYVDQIGDRDLSAHRSVQFGTRRYDTIREALCLGGNKLAVDAVLLIGEHGDYPSNEKGQKLYPRYEFFKQVVEVFERSGKAVPVFNDKHLSYSTKKCAEMVADSKRLGFPFLAGSSLPVTHRLPAIDLPWGCELEEGLVVGVGSSDAMDYHALEAMQCMMERRKGGETGVKAVQMIEGDTVWRAMRDRRWDPRLLEAALSRSETHRGLTDRDSRTQDLANNGELQRLVKNPSAYFIEYADGVRSTLLMLNGAVGDFTFAGRMKDGKRASVLFYLSPGENVNYSACLASQAEEMFMTGRAPYPVERTQMASSILDRCLDSRMQGHERIETADLNIRYQAPRASRFCRA